MFAYHECLLSITEMQTVKDDVVLLDTANWRVLERDALRQHAFKMI